jgi:DNA replication and repair protein RecF
LRRKFFDNLISQVSREYLEHLISYTHHLKQRNGLLRIFSERGSVDPEMLEVYDQKLVSSGIFIYQKRREMLAEFHPLFENQYRFLVDDSREDVQIKYRSELETMDFAGVLRNNLDRDILLQRTTSGIHRDDFLFSLNGGELKRLGSQGQQKSFLIALKLTEFQSIAQVKKLKPLLLLDDIFDKLDDARIHKLMMLVANGNFGQLMITDARAGRSKEILTEGGLKAETFTVEQGTVMSV